MKLTVNGEERECRARTVLALIEEMGACAVRVAVLVNDDVIPAAQRADRILKEGDRVELVTFAAGG